MTICEWRGDKRQFLPLLLLADEQESMIFRYLERGTMFILSEGSEVRGECVVTEESGGIAEIKNLAVEPNSWRKGYGRALIDFVSAAYKEKYSVLQVGTGDSPMTIPFYESCGFVRHHIVKDFFTAQYDHPIYECGKQLVDMIYLQKKL